MPAESYQQHVADLENHLAPYAKRSFEEFSALFVNGRSIIQHFEETWRKNPQKLERRTPIQIERDRILYSESIRRLSEKYHVLYSGQRRIVRNYITHTMRMAHVTRSICRGLSLNQDLGEAIALGSKAGALPFIHASKEAVANWAKKKISEIDETKARNHPVRGQGHGQLKLDFGASQLPDFIREIRSEYVFENIRSCMPWAAGNDVSACYSSGQQSYWQLCTEPYQGSAKPSNYLPETMYGIWRHSLGHEPRPDSFHHKCQLEMDEKNIVLELRWNHATYESIIVQYADDVTWVLENLGDANTASLLSGHRNSIFTDLQRDLKNAFGDIPLGIFKGLTEPNTGKMYSYFINDLVGNSGATLMAANDDARERRALRRGVTSSELIGCSAEARAILERMKLFLKNQVFSEKRVSNRFTMLRTLSTACVDLLFDDNSTALQQRLTERAQLDQWSQEQERHALANLENPLHRLQFAINAFAEMSDQEIYDFVGVQSL